MYETSPSMFAVKMKDVPQMDTGAPMPVVLADEDHVVLSYIVVNRPDALDLCVSRAVITFHDPRTHIFGSPNDETLSGHPLWGKGVEHYAAFIVHNFTLIEKLKRMTSVHRRHDPRRFEQLNPF